MSSNQKNFAILFGVVAIATALCAIWLNSAGASEENQMLLLRLTARVSFMIFLVIFIARPLRQLFPTDMSRWLLRERRSLGIGFAAMHSVHLGLIAYSHSTVEGLDFEPSGSIPGMIAYALIYLMLITSFDKPARALGPKNWRRLHKTGLYFIGLVFLGSLKPDEGMPILTIERAWFVILSSAAVFLRLTAYFANRKS